MAYLDLSQTSPPEQPSSGQGGAPLTDLGRGGKGEEGKGTGKRSPWTGSSWLRKFGLKERKQLDSSSGDTGLAFFSREFQAWHVEKIEPGLRNHTMDTERYPEMVRLADNPHLPIDFIRQCSHQRWFLTRSLGALDAAARHLEVLIEGETGPDAPSPNVLRSAVWVMTYSVVESWLQRVDKAARETFKPKSSKVESWPQRVVAKLVRKTLKLRCSPEGLSGRNLGGLRRYSKYLKDEARIDFPDQNPQWEQLLAIGTVRNSIAHQGGRAGEKPEKLEKAVALLKHVRLETWGVNFDSEVSQPGGNLEAEDDSNEQADFRELMESSEPGGREIWLDAGAPAWAINVAREFAETLHERLGFPRTSPKSRST